MHCNKIVIFTKIFTMKKTLFATNRAGIIEYTHAKKYIWISVLFHLQKYTPNESKDLNLKAKSIKFSEKDMI